MVESYDAEFKQRFAKSFLDMLILRLIREESMWGYRIIKEIEGHFRVKTGTVPYIPCLTRLKLEDTLPARKKSTENELEKCTRSRQKGHSS